MKELGYGKDYVYPPDDPNAPPQTFLPDELVDQRFYHPVDAGLESELKRRLDEFQQRGKKK
jgi:putative ATPase